MRRADLVPFSDLSLFDEDLGFGGFGLSRLQREIDRLFDDFVGLGPRTSVAGGRFSPPLDVEESDDQYRVFLDLPGMKRDDVNVEVRGNTLVISGERKASEDRPKGRARERYYGRFVRSLSLPPFVDTNKMNASFENGVLCVEIPKSETAKPRQIPIQEARGVLKGGDTRSAGKKEEKSEKQS